MASTHSEGYSEAHIKRLLVRLRELRNTQPNIQIDLSYLSEQLTVERATTFVNQAMGRRLPVIERAVLNIFNIYPPGRRNFLTKTECTDVAIQLHAFAINVYAVLDNAAWICMLEASGNLPPMKVGLFKKECKRFLPPALQTYISEPTVQRWFKEYGKVYRDSTAHRIPPYLPERIYTPEEGERWQDLNRQSMAVLFGWKPGDSEAAVKERLAKHERLQAEKEQIGRNSVLVALSLTGDDATHPILLHPQLLNDWGLTHEFVRTFIRAMRQHYGWQSPKIPPISVN